MQLSGATENYVITTLIIWIYCDQTLNCMVFKLNEHEL